MPSSSQSADVLPEQVKHSGHFCFSVCSISSQGSLIEQLILIHNLCALYDLQTLLFQCYSFGGKGILTSQEAR